jgi:hypothetical protein
MNRIKNSDVSHFFIALDIRTVLKCMYTAEKYTYITYILYRSVCPLVEWSYATLDEAVNPLTPMQCRVLNGNSVF